MVTVNTAPPGRQRQVDMVSKAELPEESLPCGQIQYTEELFPQPIPTSLPRSSYLRIPLEVGIHSFLAHRVDRAGEINAATADKPSQAEHAADCRGQADQNQENLLAHDQKHEREADPDQCPDDKLNLFPPAHRTGFVFPDLEDAVIGVAVQNTPFFRPHGTMAAENTRFPDEQEGVGKPEEEVAAIPGTNRSPNDGNRKRQEEHQKCQQVDRFITTHQFALDRTIFALGDGFPGAWGKSSLR